MDVNMFWGQDSKVSLLGCDVVIKLDLLFPHSVASPLGTPLATAFGVG